MKRLNLFVMFICLAVVMSMTTACSRVVPGEEGFLVNNWGDDKGEITTVGTGLHWYNPFKFDLRTYEMQLQNVSWETADSNTGYFSWNDKEGMTFMSDVGISYRVLPGGSGKIFMKYRKGLEEVTNIDMKNKLQDAFNIAGSKRRASEIYGEGKTEFIDEVQSLLQGDFKDMFVIEKVSLKGRMVLPKKVQDGIELQMQAKQTAKQRENEIAEAEAERKKRKELADADAYTITANATARAKSIEMIQQQLAKSPDYIEYLKAEKWDGQLPVYTNGVPMIKIAPEK